MISLFGHVTAKHNAPSTFPDGTALREFCIALHATSKYPNVMEHAFVMSACPRASEPSQPHKDLAVSQSLRRMSSNAAGLE